MKQKITVLGLSAGALLLALVGCARANSDDISSSSINARFSVSPNKAGTSVTCSADLTVGSDGVGGTRIDLSSTDKLTCTDGTTEKQLTGSAGNYEATGLAKEDGQSYNFKLTRTNVGDCGHAEELSSVVTLPPIPVISAPAASATLSRAGGFTVSWTPGEDSITVTLSSNATATGAEGETGTATWSGTDASGTLSVAAADLVSFRNGSALLSVKRSRSGTHSAVLKGDTSSSATGSVTITVAD